MLLIYSFQLYDSQSEDHLVFLLTNLVHKLKKIVVSDAKYLIIVKSLLNFFGKCVWHLQELLYPKLIDKHNSFAIPEGNKQISGL